MSYIVSREKPKACMDCRFLDRFFYDCILMGVKDYEDYDTQYANCPLIEVQTPHGRLIDADAFDERVRVAGGMSEEELTEDFKDGVQTVLYMLSKQPTIIEAEGSET